MGPRIKRNKPNNQAPTASARAQDQQTNSQSRPDQQTNTTNTTNSHSRQDQQQRQLTQEPAHITKLRETFDNSKPSSSSKPADADDRSITERRSGRPQSWYHGGSWREKASPVAQATRESISVAGGTTNEALAGGTGRVGRYMNNTLRRQSTKSIPTLPLETRINATRSSSELDVTMAREKKDAQDGRTGEPTLEEVDEAKDGGAAVKPQDSTLDDAPRPPDPTKDNASQTDTSSQGVAPPAQRGWFGWWSRPDGYNPEQEKADEAAKEMDSEMVEASTTPLPGTPAPLPTDPLESADTTPKSQSTPIQIEAPAKAKALANGDAGYGSTRSWFGLWSKAQNTQSRPEESSTLPQQSPPESSPPPPPPALTEEPTKANDATAAERPVEDSPGRPKSAGWAFWSRESKDGQTSTPNGTERQIGELAVADTPSQSHPEAAQFNQEREREREKKTKTKQLAKVASLTKLSRVSLFDPPAESTGSPPPTRPPTPEPAKAMDNATKPAPGKSAKSPTRPPNMVMPSFRDTYSPAYIPSYWERASQYVASSLRLIDNPAPVNHVSISPTLPKVKNAVAIGVHGYFPAPLIQKVLGPPTGTSIRFANHASAAIRAWTEAHQPDSPCEIETVALEGEGFIADRVNTLWKLLLNWLSHLRQADLIFVACHSQGVPVAVMLVSKLIQLGCLSPHAKIGICAMAGVNLGPFADYKSRLLGAGSAAELFEFSRAGSKVSTEYAHALDVVLRHSVRITYIGSIDDQLVSLESSTFTTLSHPYVYRAVFVDGRVHAPDFITHLVSFVLKLRNLGISDHNLIRELSLPLAGSLYGGQGHSTVYDDEEVYKLALSFCLETTDLEPPPHQSQSEEAQARRSSRGGPPSSITAANALRRGSMSAAAVTGIAPVLTPFELPASGSNSNPYFLPWALRGILEEDVVKRDMRNEVLEMVQRFEEWRPVSKVLKDVRFRLEGVKQSYGSKL